MHIEVRQQKLAIGDKYEVFIDGNLKFKVKSTLFRLFFSELQLYDLNDNRVGVINQGFDWFKLKYSIKLNHLLPFEIYTKRIFAMEYEAKISNDTYLITRHAGLKISVFKNGTQIASASKNHFTWFEGDIFSMDVESHIDPLIMISFILCIDNFYYNDNNRDGMFTLDIGNIGLFSKKYNYKWKAKR